MAKRGKKEQIETPILMFWTYLFRTGMSLSKADMPEAMGAFFPGNWRSADAWEKYYIKAKKSLLLDPLWMQRIFALVTSEDWNHAATCLSRVMPVLEKATRKRSRNRKLEFLLAELNAPDAAIQ